MTIPYNSYGKTTALKKKRQLQRKTNSLAPAESLDGSQGVAAKEVPGRALSSPEMP